MKLYVNIQTNKLLIGFISIDNDAYRVRVEGLNNRLPLCVAALSVKSASIAIIVGVTFAGE